MSIQSSFNSLTLTALGAKFASRSKSSVENQIRTKVQLQEEMKNRKNALKNLDGSGINKIAQKWQEYKINALSSKIGEINKDIRQERKVQKEVTKFKESTKPKEKKKSDDVYLGGEKITDKTLLNMLKGDNK